MKYTFIKEKILSIIILTAAANICFPADQAVQHHTMSYFFTMGPMGILNTESSTKSAPSPIVFTVGFGIKIPDDTRISFEPRAVFFTNYYLWDGENALPAEVENRTAIALSMLLDIPVVMTFYKGQHSFEAGTGLALLTRYGILAGGVSSSDTGETGSASGDVDKINNWFWTGAHFLYPEIVMAWNYRINDRLQAGLEQHLYFPLGSMINGRGLDAMMYTVSARIMFR